MRYLTISVALCLIAISPFVGQIPIEVKNIFEVSTMDHQIFWDIRVPRVILAFCVGSILALSGLVFQTVFRNSMATPFTLGVASGATLFTALGIVLGVVSFISLWAFAGSILTIIILFAISKTLGSTRDLFFASCRYSTFFFLQCKLDGALFYK